MKIKSVEMTNFLGIESLEIDIPREGLVLICGPNWSGKSTLLDAIRFAICGRVGRGNSAEFCDDGRLLRQGTREGMVSIEIADNKYGSRLSRNVSDGIVSDPSLMMSVGSKSHALFPDRFFVLDKGARRMALLRSSGIEPSEGLLEKALREACDAYLQEDNALEAAVKTVLDDYEDAGFAHAESCARDKARSAKRKWNKVTGDRWGPKIGVNWKPEDTGSEGIDMEKAAARVKGLREALSGLWRDRQDIFSHEAEVLKKTAVKLRDRRGRLARQATSHVVACPECGCVLSASTTPDGAVKLDVGSPEKINIGRIRRELNDINIQLGELENSAAFYKDLSEAMPEPLHEMEANRLAIFLGRISDDDRDSWLAASREESALAKEIDEAAKADFDSKEKVIEASEAHREILLWLALADVVSPGGLPSQLTTPAVDAVNAAALELSAALGLGWNAELLRSDMSLAGEGLISHSEEWLVDLSVAIGMARGAPFLILDGMDILQTQEARRGKLLSFLEKMADRGEFGQIFVAATLKSAPGAVPGQLGVIKLPVHGHEPDHYLSDRRLS